MQMSSSPTGLPYRGPSPARPAAELVDVGKQPHHHRVSQTEIETQMIARARLGASVVRLKGGDPFVFGRGAEEMVAAPQPVCR